MKHSENPTPTFGQRLRWVRGQNGLTLDEFGSRIGVGRSYLSKLENGKRNTTSEQFLFALAHVFHVRRDWILNGEGEPFEKPEGRIVMKDPKELQMHPLADQKNAAFIHALSVAGMVLVTNPTIRGLAVAVTNRDGKYDREHEIAEIARIILSVELASQICASAEKALLDKPINEPLSEYGRMAISVAKAQKARWEREDMAVTVPNKGLTDIHASANMPDVKAQWPLLKKRIQKATKIPGGKTRLAEFLGLKLASVSQWLTDSENAREPGAETALRMLYWVEQQERK